MGSEKMKRKGPVPLTPLKINGIRYTEIRDARSIGYKQAGGVVAAIDDNTGDELWRVLVYKILYDQKEESDVQDVFITSIEASPDGMALLITNERRQQFLINLADQSVNTAEQQE